MLNRGSARLRAVAVAVAIAGFLSVAAPSAEAQAYAYTGSEQLYIIPAGTTLVHVVAIGARGGNAGSVLGGAGAVVSADLPVPQAQSVLYVEVGGTGHGFNGGGLSNGGDASDVRLLAGAQAGSIDSRIIVAGGGGGAGAYPGGNAGADGGGGTAGGKAGTQTAGGAGGLGQPPDECSDGFPGSLGSGGDGVADFFSPAAFGGGGGGYYGGGGGGSAGGCDFPSSYPTGLGGGGGGSNYVAPQATNATQGLDPSGTPSVTITPVTAVIPSGRPVVALSGLRVNPRTFVLGGRLVGGHCVPRTVRNKQARPCRRPVTLRISYTLSAPGTVTFTLERTSPGRKVGGRCVSTSRGNRHAASCRRTITLAGSFSQAGVSGRNTLVFRGRIGGLDLNPASYRLFATPPGSLGASAAGTATFRFLP